MNRFVKKSVTEIQISGIRTFNQLASKVDGVIKLTIGELDLHSPEAVKDKAIQAIQHNQTKYTENAGLALLREKITAKYDMFTKDDCIITVGTTEGLAILLKTILNPEDEVIIPTPGYVGYKPLVHLENAKVVEINTLADNRYISKEALDKAYSNNTKAMIITNPNNPTGYVLSKEQMKVIVEFVLEKDILLISDEIYSKTYHDHVSFAEFPELKDNLVLLDGFSKSHAMTGYRIGYLLTNEALRNECLKVHQYYVTSASSISQYAALKAVSEDYYELPSILEKRRQLVVDSLQKMDIPYILPNGAFYVFANISQYAQSGESFAMELLNNAKIAVIPGEYFLGEHSQFVRISYAIDDESLKTALSRIEAFIKQKK